MKKLKLILIAIIAIVLIAIFAIGSNIYSASGAINLENIPNDGSWYKNNTYFSISFAHLINYNNVYCIQKNQSFPRQGKYMEAKYRIVINGENAKIYKCDKLYPGSGRLVKECDGEYNNLLAAILCEREMGLGYGSDSKHYNNSQIALYYYWSTWIRESGTGAFISSSSGNSSIVSQVGQKRINEIMEKYKEYASRNAYSATIYYLVPAFNSVQRLILVERGEKTELDLDIPVKKVWHDGENKYNTRGEIVVELLANGDGTGKTLKLNNDNGWKDTFEDLDLKDSSGKKIEYTVKETNVPSGYVTTTVGDMNNGYTITNTLLTEVKVVKKWEDLDDLDEFRPKTLDVTLYSNNVSTGRKVILNEQNNWTAKFENLKKYDGNGNEIKYTVKESTVAEYEIPVYKEEEDSNGYTTWTITNKHTPHYDGYIEISGKVWLDKEFGKDNNINGVFDEDKDTRLEGITVRLKYIDENGKAQLFNSNLPNVYETKTNSNGEYTIIVNYDNSKNVYKLYEDINTVNAKLKTAYVEFEYDGIKYTTVNDEVATKKVVDEDGNETTVDVPSSEQSKAVENETSRNNLDNKYSTVTTETTSPDTWTDKNITASTKNINSYEKGQDENKEVVIKYCNGNGTCDRTNPKGAWMIIENQELKYPCDNCTKTGHDMKTYNITVQKIPNINLGLFKREQPNVAIFSDLSKVEVTMNNQKYTYLYGVRGSDNNDVGLKAKFENKGTYTYRRPVNPADIAYINRENAPGNELSVLVSYEVKVANLSTTLQTTINEISNIFDSNYEIVDIIRGNTTVENPQYVNYSVSNIYPTNNKFKEITLKDLNITLQSEKEAKENDIITIRYRVNIEAIKTKLLNDKATLNNAVEILSYSTRYGTETLYAEQRLGGRINKDGIGQPYAGYDNNSKPGNAGIFYDSSMDKLRSEQAKQDYIKANGGNGISSIDDIDEENKYLEDDTDFAPSFVLCKDEEPKTLSGTIFEDKDEIQNDNERLGNGQYDNGEAVVENVRVELHEVIRDGNGNIVGTQLAKLYNSTTKELDRDAITKTDSDGKYYLDGVVTGEYFIKYTYGDDTTALGYEATTMDGGATKVNARNYKSTIIKDTTVIDPEKGTTFINLLNRDYSTFSEAEKKWHITHADGYSVALDNMQERLEIEVDDLIHSNFSNALNMTAYTKPFKIQLEFEENGSSNADQQGDINGVSNTLDRLDFGIAERPREDLFAQKTITYAKITLSNGQVLTEGNPSDPESSMNYIKAMGLSHQATNGREARNALERQLLVELDSELMQGAQLELKYEVRIVNNSEIDYDHGNKNDADYVAEFANTSKQVYDKFITQNPKASYYYYGVKGTLQQTQAVIEFVDYIDTDLVYNEDTDNWIDFENDSLITQDVKNAINENGYKALQGIVNSSTRITLPRGVENAHKQEMTATKLLSNKDENVYDNNIEILSVDGKTARTIQESNNGVQIEKSYQFGNYEPSLAAGTFEQNDDRVKIIITPPTGIANYIITYVVVVLVGLVIIGIAIVIIKKKGLIK